MLSAFTPHAGLTVARRDSPACFSGASSHRTDICIPSQASKGPAQEQKTRGSQKSSRRSKKSKGSGGPSANISLAAAIGVIFAVFVPVVLLLRRFLQRGALAAPLEEGPWANLGQGHKLGTKQD